MSAYMWVDAARRWSGVSTQDINEGMRLMETDDPFLGAGYMVAAGRAVAIKGDCVAYNKRQAPMIAAQLRSRAGQPKEEL